MKLFDKTRPIIGISPGYAGPDPMRNFAPAGRIVFCDMNYIECTEIAGGLPFLVTFSQDKDQLNRIADHIDGLILIGGVDIHASRYGQEMLPTEQLPVPERDDFEFALLEKFIEREKPIFGICRGYQVLNVYFGGTLIQDIPSQLGSVHHLQTPGSQTIAHQVKLNEESLAYRIFGSTLVDVNSFHHQAVDKLGDGLKAVGWSEEGIVEVFEHISHPYLHAVQWHPERMRNFPEHQLLFNDFVKTCNREQLELVG